MYLSAFLRSHPRALLGSVLLGLVSCTGTPQGIGCPECTGAPGGGSSSTAAGGTNSVESSRVSGAVYHGGSLWRDPVFHGTLVRAAGYDYNQAFVGALACSACHAGDSPTQPSPNLRAPTCFACHDGGPDGSAFHPEGWLDVTDRNFHGNVVVAAGYDFNKARSGALSCSACHAGLYPDQPSPNSRAPSCFTCHSGGPDGSAGHPRGWMDMNSPTFHGRVASLGGFRSPGQLSCAACHVPWKGHEGINTRAPSCFACHAGGPDGSPGHPPGWSTPASGSFHGKPVKSAGGYTKARAGGLTCDTCHAGRHANEPSPVAKAPSCHSCHAGGPDGSAHPAGWDVLGHPAFHGAVVKAAGGPDAAKVLGRTCTSCHAASGPSQSSPVARAPSCYSCHAGGPDGTPGHPRDGWTWNPGNPAFHGAVVKAAGGDYTRALAGGLTCSACHAGDSPGRVSPVKGASNCFSCHAGGPSGAMHPAGWTTPGNPEFHGSYVARNGGLENALVGRGMACAFCHGTRPAAASSWSDAPNCTTCHQAGTPGVR